jgi:hypothetical protein
MESPGVEQPHVVEGSTPHDCRKNAAAPAVQARGARKFEDTLPGAATWPLSGAVIPENHAVRAMVRQEAEAKAETMRGLESQAAKECADAEESARKAQEETAPAKEKDDKEVKKAASFWEAWKAGAIAKREAEAMAKAEAEAKAKADAEAKAEEARSQRTKWEATMPELKPKPTPEPTPELMPEPMPEADAKATHEAGVKAQAEAEVWVKASASTWEKEKAVKERLEIANLAKAKAEAKRAGGGGRGEKVGQSRERVARKAG